MGPLTSAQIEPKVKGLDWRARPRALRTSPTQPASAMAQSIVHARSRTPTGSI